jgi:hypothetical protein
MNEELMPRVYREYCWFALVLLMLTVGFVGRPPPGETSTRATAPGAPSAPAALSPPAHRAP